MWTSTLSLFYLFSSGVHFYNIWISEDVVTKHCGTGTFKYSFFTLTILEWNELDLTLQESSYKVIRKYLLRMILPLSNLVYVIHNPLDSLNHLNKHKFNHNFENYVNLLCTCRLKIESTFYFLLHCMHYNNIQIILLSALKSFDRNILKLLDTNLINLMLYDGSWFNKEQIIQV